MVCRAGGQYLGDDQPAKTKNWSGDVPFTPATWKGPKHVLPNPNSTNHPPQEHASHPLAGPLVLTDPSDGLASLVEAVADATENGQAVHAIGSGWAFEDCAKSDGMMISLANLNWQLFDVVDSNNGALTDDSMVKQGALSPTHLVHFEAGIRIYDLCTQLNSQGLAMPTLGGSNGQSLVGALSTSTHGGDWQQPPLPDVVRAVHLVTHGGQEWWIESATNPLTRADEDSKALRNILPCKTTMVIRDDQVFNAVRVACGRFGVIYSLVLEVTRQFRLVHAVTTPSKNAVLQALRDGQGTPSVFTPLFRLLNNDPLPPGLNDAKGVPYFLQIVFNSQRPSDVWATRRWVTTDQNDLPDDPYGSKNDLAVAIITLVNAALLEVAGVAGGTVAAIGTAVGSIFLGPLAGILAAEYGTATSVAILEMVAELDILLASGNAPFGALLAAALTAAWTVPGLGYLIPQIEGMVTEEQLRGGKKRNGLRGPHYVVTTSSMAANDQNDYRSDSIEVIFDATAADYLDFLDEILPIAPLFQQAGYVSLRPSLRSSALLSMHNVAGRRAISIEIASVKNLPGNLPWMAYVHQAALRHNGRPHWGQYNKLDAMAVAMLYGDSLNQWREALLKVSGTSTVFSNAFTRQRGLEPLGIVREVTSVKKKSGKITHLCNDGMSWSPIAVSQAIQEIQAGTAKYFARRGDSVALIKVVSDGHGGFYLRTQSDQTSADNLDNLPLSMLP